jgi:hypothetical protein
MSLPKDFEELIYLLDKQFNFKNILIVNTICTGIFLDSLFLEKKTLRIKYNQNEYNKFVNQINNLNTKFDLICVDPFHEYIQSISDYNLLTKLLTDDGILVSHDCNPSNFKAASPTCLRKGEWSGVTYAAFVEIAYKNPDWFYAVINKDFGLGIISKKEIQFVKKIENNNKQKIFLDLFKQNKYEQAYNYFVENSNDIINLIN